MIVTVLAALALVFDLINTLLLVVIWVVLLAVDVGIWLGRRDAHKAQ